MRQRGMLGTHRSVSLAGGASLTLDTSVPGVEAALAASALAQDPSGAVRIAWQRVPRRCGLLHLLDAVEGAGLCPLPCRADALSGWDDMHGSESGSGMLSADTGNRPVEVTEFQALVTRNEDDSFVNHVWMVPGSRAIRNRAVHWASRCRSSNISAQRWGWVTAATTSTSRRSSAIVSADSERASGAPPWLCVGTGTVG